VAGTDHLIQERVDGGGEVSFAHVDHSGDPRPSASPLSHGPCRHAAVVESRSMRLDCPFGIGRLTVGDVEMWGLIDAQPVVFPARSLALSMAFLDWGVPLKAARTLVPEEALEPVASEDGRAHVTLVFADYRRNDWGATAFAALTVPVRPAGDVDAVTGVRLCHGVTSAPFADEVMYWALGVPGAKGALDVAYLPDEVHARVVVDGREELAIRLPRRQGPTVGPPFEAHVYAWAGEGLRRVRVEQAAPDAVVPPEDVHLDVGHGPMADALTRLTGLRSPDSCLFGEQLATTIHRPRPLGATSTP
jgi:hypothetical protein